MVRSSRGTAYRLKATRVGPVWGWWSPQPHSAAMVMAVNASGE